MEIPQLQHLPLFHEVALTDLQALLTLMPCQQFPAGTLIVTEQSAGDRMYIVITGQARIYVEDEQGYQLTVGMLASGQTFGELSLLDEAPRAASVLAETDVEVLMLHRVDFLAFIHERPQVGIAMMQNLAAMIRQTNLTLEQFVGWSHRLANENDPDQIINEVQKTVTPQTGRGLVEAFLNMARRLR